MSLYGDGEPNADMSTARLPREEKLAEIVVACQNMSFKVHRNVFIAANTVHGKQSTGWDDGCSFKKIYIHDTRA